MLRHWMHSMKRGRPAMTMTPRRSQVWNELAECEATGKRVTLTKLAERCGLYSYRDARRIVADLVRMGMLGQ